MTGRGLLKGKLAGGALLLLALTACNPERERPLGGEAGNDADQFDEAANALEAKARVMVRAAVEATDNAMGIGSAGAETTQEDMPPAGR